MICSRWFVAGLCLAAVLVSGCTAPAVPVDNTEAEGPHPELVKRYPKHTDKGAGLNEKEPGNLLTREKLAGDPLGGRSLLEDLGVSVDLGVTHIYQHNVRGGISTRSRSGRQAGSYDLEFTTDLDKALGLTGGELYVHAEGSWSDGIEETVGSTFGVNGDAGGNRVMDVTELWYEHTFGSDHELRVRLGKLDLGGGFECRGCPVSFDGNSFANDETAQFLNGALVNNPTIPLPDKGLGVVIYFKPTEWAYVSAGAGDAQADARETGLNTTFGQEDDFFYIFEAGVTPQIASANGPLQGAYRAGVWFDPQRKTRFSNGRVRRDDAGLYFSFDQMLCRESAEEGDDQGLGVFFRYGLASEKINAIRNFWSIGMQYKGLIPDRDADVVGLGFAQGVFARHAGFTETDESVLELFYNIELTPWFHLSPSLQFLNNLGGLKTMDDSTVIGLRAQFDI